MRMSVSGSAIRDTQVNQRQQAQWNQVEHEAHAHEYVHARTWVRLAGGDWVTEGGGWGLKSEIT